MIYLNQQFKLNRKHRRLIEENNLMIGTNHKMIRKMLGLDENVTPEERREVIRRMNTKKDEDS